MLFSNTIKLCYPHDAKYQVWTHTELQLGDEELASGDWREGKRRGCVIPLVIFLPRGYVTHITELY
jgi:hypothetical protein